MFWKAFKAEDRATLEAFFQQVLPEEKLREMSAADRAQRLLGLRQQLGGELQVLRVLTPGPDEISIIISNDKKNLFRLTLAFEKQSRGGLQLKRLAVDEAGLEDLAPPLPAMSLEQALQNIQEELEKAAQEDRFSGVVLIARDSQPIFFKAYGFASKEFAVPNQRDTKFNLGSINKIFTKIAIARLAQEGRLSLDDKLGRFLPDYPNTEAREKVTIRHLVNMTSGISDFFGPEFEATPKDLLRHNRDYLKLFASKPLAFEPGTRQMYSNGGYVVLGEIISAVSGLDYYDYVRKNIFEPAGMKDSDWFEADAVVPNLAEGYTKRAEEPEDTAGALKNKDKSDKPSTISPEAEIRPENKNQPGKPVMKTAIQMEKGPIHNYVNPSINLNDMPNKSQTINSMSAADNQSSQNSESGAQSQNFNASTWRKNIYTRPARGSAAGGGYSTAEDLLRFIRALYECRLLDERWTNWVFTGVEPEARTQGEKEPGNSLNINENNSGQKSTSKALANGSPNITGQKENCNNYEPEFTRQVQEGSPDISVTNLANMARRDTESQSSGYSDSTIHPDGQFAPPTKPDFLQNEGKRNLPKPTIDRRFWNLGIAGGAPGINAVLEFEGQTGFTIIVLANYDPPAAVQIGRMVRRYLEAVKK
ncbi:MAG: serine hydrolase domain-containing protein [Candidatus Saccharicenans sp.]